MTNLDFDAILKDLGTPKKVGRPLPVDRESLLAAAERMVGRGYRHTTVSLEALTAYIEGYGLILGGDVGTGKTLFFDCVGELPVVRFSILKWSSQKLDIIEDWMCVHKDEEIVVDDIGSEPVYNNYGCRLDLLPWIIEYRLCSRERTHFTTNLTSKQLIDRYGARVVDRLHELCMSFKFSGPSLRVTRVSPEASDVSRADWTLCSERCAYCKDGKGCAAGFAMPCYDPRRGQYAVPPENCFNFSQRV